MRTRSESLCGRGAGPVAVAGWTRRPAMPEGQAPHLHLVADAGAMMPEGTGMKNGVDMAVAEVGGRRRRLLHRGRQPRRRLPADRQVGRRGGGRERQQGGRGSARHRLHRHLQLRRGEGLHPDQQPRPHGADHPGQYLPGPHQEAGRRARASRRSTGRWASSTTSARSPPTTSRARSPPSGPSAWA